MCCCGWEHGLSTPLWLSGKRGCQGSSKAGPHCGQDAKFDRYRTCHATTLMGRTAHERAYDHCAHCGPGDFPTDSEFGREHKQSAVAREVIALAVSLTSFGEAARDVLTRLTGLVLSASTR